MQLRTKKRNEGFTLLEIIIVIIIVGVLASLALPKFFSTVEYSRSTEALNFISTIRNSIERCGLDKGEDFTDCNTFANLDIADPSNDVGTNFSYAITSAGDNAFTIVATRKTVNGGDSASTITLTRDSVSGVTKSGTGAFEGI